MSRVHDKDVAAADPTVREPAGRVEVDSRGHNVWRWAKEVIDNTSVLLKRLENKDLALEPTQKVPVVRPADAAPASAKPAAKASIASRKQPAQSPPHPALQRQRTKPDAGGGFDPYNSR
jgi:hypothetical protein